MEQKFILLDGTSSAGKSIVCEFFSNSSKKRTNKFVCLQFDKYYHKLFDKKIYHKLYKTIPNKYGAESNLNDLEKLTIKYMVDDAIKSKSNCLLDYVSLKEIIKYIKSLKIDVKKHLKLFIINIFTNLTNLARNIELRRKAGDPRGVFAFTQFSKRYIKTSNNDIKKIEIVNRQQFKKILLKNFKYAFKNEKKLIEFANNIFKTMNIDDDKDHYIKLRDEFICDYLLITTNKSKQDIFKELKNIII